jgi:bacteriorhodopsin
MENDLLFTPTQHALVGSAFAVALGAHLVGLVYFLSRLPLVAPRYRTATWLSVSVMVASGYLFYRLGQSWDTAFAQSGGQMVRTGNRFDGSLRYVNWFVTVPVLLVQVLYALDLTRARVVRLRTVLVASGVVMVLTGYVGQYSSGRDDSTLLWWGLAGTPPFVGLTARNLTFVFLFFWGLYPIAYLLPALSHSAETAVTMQWLFTVADVGSKVLYGVLLAKLCRLRSAADGFEPAREVAEGALGERPEDQGYRRPAPAGDTRA